MGQMTDAVLAANSVIRTYGTRRPERLAKDMDIMILPQPFKVQKGAYKVIERQPIIFIKQDLHPVMREIVIAHELGHHKLHRAEAIAAGGFQEFNLFDMQQNRMEYDANMFAAQLMLPDDDIMELIYKGFDVAQIARALRSDINLVALKVAELNSRGHGFRPQEYRNTFLK